MSCTNFTIDLHEMYMYVLYHLCKMYHVCRKLYVVIVLLEKHVKRLHKTRLSKFLCHDYIELKNCKKKKAIHQRVWFFTKDIDTPLGLYMAHKHLTITFFLYIGEFPIMTNMNDFVFTRHYPRSVGLGLRGSTRYTGTLYLVGHCKKERIKLCVIMVPYFFPMYI